MSKSVAMKVPIIRNETTGPLMINFNDGGCLFLRSGEEKVAPKNIVWMMRQRGFVFALLNGSAEIVGDITQLVDLDELWPDVEKEESDETPELEWEE